MVQALYIYLNRPPKNTMMANTDERNKVRIMENNT
jgi:hypothetical protein